MKIKILFISSRFFYQSTVAALARIQPEFETKVVAYDCFNQILPVYEEHADQFDAILITGSGAKRMIDMAHPHNSKPVVAFQVDSDGLHRDILRLAIETQNLDFSRIAVDCLIPLNLGYSVVDFLKLTSMDPIIFQNAELIESIVLESSKTIEQYILDQILQLWNQKTIDMVLCLYPSIIPLLETHEIPFRCPFISDDNLYHLIQEVAVKAELSRLHENHPSVIQIFPRHSTGETPEKVQRIFDAFQEYITGNRIDGVLQKNDQCCTFVSTMSILRFLTNEFRLCRISSFLAEMLDFPVAVAYGIGTTIVHAMNNVQIASKEAKILGDAFIVDTNGNLIGPLNSDQRMVIPFSAQPDLSEVAKRCNLSAMTIQKVQNILRSSGSNKITIPEIAQKLNTTVRNANRIMLNLCRGNVAHPVYTQATHSRGRPIQVYALDFGTPSL